MSVGCRLAFGTLTDTVTPDAFGAAERRIARARDRRWLEAGIIEDHPA